jgi:hypothetical protein
MKKKTLINTFSVLTLTSLFSFAGLNNVNAQPVNESVKVNKVNIDNEFALGMDISSIISLEKGGVTYYDENGKKEDLFVVSNMFSDKPIENTYSLVFINNDGKTKMLYNKLYKGNMNMGGCYAYLYGIIQVEKSDVPQIVTKCSYYSVTLDNEYGLYQFNRNNYELLLYSKKM